MRFPFPTVGCRTHIHTHAQVRTRKRLERYLVRSLFYLSLVFHSFVQPNPNANLKQVIHSYLASKPKPFKFNDEAVRTYVGPPNAIFIFSHKFCKSYVINEELYSSG